MELIFDLGFGLLSWIFPIVFIGMGLLFVLVAVATSRSSRSVLPDDGNVAEIWSSAGLEPTSRPDDVVWRAATRLKLGLGVKGHDILGLPGPTGVRLVATGRMHGHDVHVADVWHVTSVSSVGSEVVDATVRLRALAAVALPSVHDRVVAGPARLLDDLRDAVGPGEIQLESVEFNRDFAVRADDRQLATAVLTPQVLGALIDAEVLALELSGDLLTIHEVTGSGHLSGGQAVLGATFATAVDAILAGLRPHTWPTIATAPAEPRSRSRLALDHRGPGAPHGRGDPGAGRTVRLGLGMAGLLFAAMGVVFLVLR